MSPWGSRSVSPNAYDRYYTKNKLVLDLDLNLPPSCICNEVGTTSHVPRDPPQVQASQQRSMRQVVPIDVDSFDDDVLFISPWAFAEAKNNSRRKRTRINVDVYPETTIRNGNIYHWKRQRIPTNQPIIDCESYEVSSANCSVGNSKNLPVQTKSMAPSIPPPIDPTFKCPVCLGPLVEETSTKCGHIFCKDCIKKSISSQGKCPTCRKKVTMRGTMRIYLPATT